MISKKLRLTLLAALLTVLLGSFVLMPEWERFDSLNDSVRDTNTRINDIVSVSSRLNDLGRYLFRSERDFSFFISTLSERCRVQVRNEIFDNKNGRTFSADFSGSYKSILKFLAELEYWHSRKAVDIWELSIFTEKRVHLRAKIRYLSADEKQD